MQILCDSNIFLALCLESHPHHQRVLSWLDKLADGDGVCFCRATQQTFLTVKEWLKEDVCTNEGAIAVYRQVCIDERVGFVVEEASGIEDLWLKLASLPECAPKLWMDAYLAALAISHSLPFATLDKGFERYRSQGLELLLLT